MCFPCVLVAGKAVKHLNPPKMPKLAIKKMVFTDQYIRLLATDCKTANCTGRRNARAF